MEQDGYTFQCVQELSEVWEARMRGVWVGLVLLALTGAILNAEGSGSGRLMNARLNDHISHYEPVNLTGRAQVSNHHKLVARFNITAFGRSFNLKVKTYTTLFHPDFHLVVVGNDGQATRKRVNTRHFVAGNIEGERGSLVFGRVVNNSFDGIIHSEGELYHIDPIHHHKLAKSHPQLVGVAPGEARVIYRASDVEYDKFFSTCHSGNSSRMRLLQKSAASSNYFTHFSDSLRRKRQSSTLNTCTVKLVADYRFFEKIGGESEKNTLDEMVLHLMNADNIYRSTTFYGNNGEILGSRLSIHSSVIFTDSVNNPLAGDFNVEELLEAFSEEHFDDVCLGHLFTYRDYQGTIGLAYLGDPNGQLAGGICQKRTRTSLGEVNLNTGFTSLLNNGARLSRAVSFITVAHEIGHNHGAEHDSSGECYTGKYIMYPYATSGNDKGFSECSKSFIGRTIEARGSCFIAFPSGAECGNGIVEGEEECDCGETVDQARCSEVDPCCLTNCTLIPGAACSGKASTCCGVATCQPLNDPTVLCLKGDMGLVGGGCQKDTYCIMDNPECPPPTFEEDGVQCNNGSNVCEKGACVGSRCLLFENKPDPCYCEDDEELCHVCCMFGDKCTSTFDAPDIEGIYVAPNYPCKNFTGYCTDEHVCKGVDNDDILNSLRDILFDFASIWKWVKSNWYWVLGGFAAVVCLIILLQLTYRRKKLTADGEVVENSCWRFGKAKRPRVQHGRSGNRGSRTRAGPRENSGLLREERT